MKKKTFPKKIHGTLNKMDMNYSDVPVCIRLPYFPPIFNINTELCNWIVLAPDENLIYLSTN